MNLFMYLFIPLPDHIDSGRAKALLQWRLFAQNDVTVFCGEREGWKDENKVFWVDGWLNVQPLTVTHVNCIERNVLNHTDLKWNLNLKVHFTSLEPVPHIE